MATLHVEISMVDDAGRARLEVVIEEPSRFDVDRDPLWVYSRLDALAARGLAQLHDQALKIAAGDQGRGGRVA